MEASREDYEEFFAQENRRHQDKSNTRKGTKQKVKHTGPGLLSTSLYVVVVFIFVANVFAWHDAMGVALSIKFSHLFTLGGFLEQRWVDISVRLVFALAALYQLFGNNQKKSFFDYVGIAMLSMVVVMGTTAFASGGNWVLAATLCYAFQSLQYQGIFQTNKEAMRLFAFASYLVEFAIQCTQAPISPLGPLELLEALAYGTLDPDHIYVWVILLNIFCIVGVEWLMRLNQVIRGRE